MNKERTEFLSKIIPVGGIFIILCSSIKLIIFYKHFSISITDYLSIGEYATLFIDDIIYYLIIFGGGIYLNELSSYSKKDSNHKSDNFDYHMYKNKRVRIIIISSIVIIGIIILIFNIDSLYQKLEALKAGIYILLCLLYCYLSFEKTSFNFSYRSLIVTGILLHTTMDGLVDAQKIIENNNKLNYKITFDNKIISTDNDLHYLGKSEKFIYLYNLKNKEAIILSNSKLDKIQIVEKKERQQAKK
jgi:hypothetical protein